MGAALQVFLVFREGGALNIPLAKHAEKNEILSKQEDRILLSDKAAVAEPYRYSNIWIQNCAVCVTYRLLTHAFVSPWQRNAMVWMMKCLHKCWHSVF